MLLRSLSQLENSLDDAKREIIQLRAASEEASRRVRMLAAF